MTPMRVSLLSNRTSSSNSAGSARRSGRVRAWALGAVLSTIGVVAAACSPLPIIGSGSSALVAMAVNQIGASTADVSMNMNLSAGSIFSLTDSGTGGIDISKGSLAVNGNAKVLGVSIPSNFEIDNGAVYLSVPWYAELATSLKPWVSIDLTKLGSSSLEVTTILALVMDLPSFMKILGSTGNIATSIGTSTVDNQTVTGYSITLPKQLLSGATPSCLSSSSSGLSKMTLNIDAYVNAKNQLVRLATDISMPAQVIGSVAANVTLDFSGYGSTVNVAAPPSNQVDDVTSQVQQAYSLICPSSSSTTTTTS